MQFQERVVGCFKALATGDAIIYLEELWHLMHHSDEPDRAIVALTSYYDDSGSDENSPVTVIGGPAMSRVHFLEFDCNWAKRLDRYRIQPPLHMNDFVRPYGKNIGIRRELKLALFREVSELINEYKLYSTSVAIPQPEFRSSIPEAVIKELIGPYALAFFAAVQANQYIAVKTLRQELVISYLIDDGVSFKNQLGLAHSVLLSHEKARGKGRHFGAMAFDSDDRVSALQAADVIAWAARRRQVNGNLTDEFRPLESVLAEQPDRSSKWQGSHAHIVIPEEGIEMWAKPIRKWLDDIGRVPTLEEMTQ